MDPTDSTTDLLNVHESRADHPFVGRPPPRTLDEFFSDVLDRGIFENFFSSSTVDNVAQSNIAAAAIQDRHLHANNIMKKHNLMIYHDDYSGNQLSKLVCRPPFDSLHIMSAPWLSKHNHGKTPHVGVFSTKHMLLFKSNGWQQTSCLYFSEESVIPTSILDGTAWSSSNFSEGKSIVEQIRQPLATANDNDHIVTIEQLSEPTSDDWWSVWNNGNKMLSDIIQLFEVGDESMYWTPAKQWTTKDKDRNYQYLCQYYIIIYLNKLDVRQKFISARLRTVKIFSDERVPKHFTIAELAKNDEFIERIKS